MSLSESHPDLAINMITECLEIGCKFGGLVFGDYVRDVIVPRLNDLECDARFKDVGIWFKSGRDANDFIRAMDKSFISATSVTCPQFARKQFVFHKYGTQVASFDLIISGQLLVENSDFIRLTYYFSKDGCYPIVPSYDDLLLLR